MSDHTHARGDGLLRPGLGDVATGVRRLLDIAIAASVLVLIAPALAVIVLLIYLESGRPIFFSQVRLGQGGRHFRLHKFRKFAPDEGSSGPAVTLRGDARMTPVGKVLERTKLDELPQLWNILVGEMSVVGPRPESLSFQDCFGSRYRAVLDHKPGLFGPSQVLFRNEGDLYESGCDPETFYRDVLFPLKARLDLAYFARRSLRSDARWVAKGIIAVFGGTLSSRDAPCTIADVETRIRRLGSGLH